MNKRGSIPNDLRMAGPSGEVQSYWQPEAFSWHGSESQVRNRAYPYILVGKTSIRISNIAALEAGFNPGDKLQIGINKEFLAIKKDESGILAKGEPRKTKSVHITATKLLRDLAGEGYPIPCQLKCQWDAKSEMLVGKWPQNQKDGQVAP